MESIDTIIKQAVQPYLGLIDRMQKKQQEKEAEVVVMKYAMLEMDRKYKELESKLKAQVAIQKRGVKPALEKQGSTQEKKAFGSSRSNSKTVTGFSNSLVEQRQRSRTPTATKIQNQLNQSMQSTKQPSIKIGGSGGMMTARGETSRNRNSDLQSQTIRGNSTARGTKVEESKRLLDQSQKNKDLKHVTPFDSKKAKTPKESTTNIALAKPKVKGPVAKTGQSPSNKKGRDSLVQGKELLDNFKFEKDHVKATIGKAECILYPMEPAPKRNNPVLKPNAEFNLVYVPSYNGKTGRNNIEFVDKDNIVFFASTAVIVMNINTHEQQLLHGHSDEVQCLSINKSQNILCTAQRIHWKDKEAYFVIWDLGEKTPLVKVAYHQRTISQACFTANGSYLITIGGNDKMSIAVWKVSDLILLGQKDNQEIQEHTPICEYSIGKVITNTLYVDNRKSNEDLINLVMGTEKGVKFFTVKINEKVIEEKKATLTNQDNFKNAYGVAFQGDDTLIAVDNGFIYTFREDKVADSKFQASQTPAQCIGFIERNGKNQLLSLAEDGKICFWEGQDLIEQFELMDEDMKGKLGTEIFKFKAKAFTINGSTLIVGFEQNIILKFDLENKHREILIAGHANSIQNLVAHPKLKVFATVGVDKYVRFFSYQQIEENKSCLINAVELQQQAKICDFSPDGKYFTVGYENGIFEVFQVFENEGEYFQLECLKLFDLNRKYPIQCAKFSPDGKFLIISCYKDLVVFNAQTEDLEQEGILKGNSQNVIFLQYDKNSQYAMTNAVDGKVMVWELGSGQFNKIDPKQVKDLEWDRKCCIYSWDTLGIWTSEMREQDLNCVSISQDKSLIAAADTFGRPRIFCYPAHLPRQNSLSLESGHVNHVVSAQFMPFGNVFVTAGEQDCSIMIWHYKESSHQETLETIGGGSSMGSPLNISIGNNEKTFQSKDPKDEEVNDDSDTITLSAKNKNSHNDKGEEKQQL